MGFTISRLSHKLCRTTNKAGFYHRAQTLLLNQLICTKTKRRHCAKQKWWRGSVTYISVSRDNRTATKHGTKGAISGQTNSVNWWLSIKWSTDCQRLLLTGPAVVVCCLVLGAKRDSNKVAVVMVVLIFPLDTKKDTKRMNTKNVCR